MIHNRSLLFVHVPKTAGMSLTEYLLDVLPRPLWYSLPWDAGRGVAKDLPGAGVKRLGHAVTRPLRALAPALHERLFPRSRWDHREGITYLDGWRHEALKHAARLARPLEEFDKVVAVARNPYDLEVSRYTFFRRPDSVAPADEKRLAVDSDLEGFVRGSRWFGVPDGHPADYYTVDGAMPGNLDVVRFESLQDDLRRVLSELGVDAERPLPWKNRTRHASWSDSLTPGAEEAIYERWRFLFDTGLYGRVGTE